MQAITADFYDPTEYDLMVHLLKKVSVFLLVAEDCYVQVAEYPMYNLPTVGWPFLRMAVKKGRISQLHLKTSKKRKRKVSKSSMASKNQKLSASMSGTTSRHAWRCRTRFHFQIKVSTVYFPWETVLYSSNLRENFSKNHITSTTPANKRNKSYIHQEEQTQSSKVDKAKKIERIWKRFLAIRPSFEHILQHHKKYQLINLLSRHCKETSGTSNRKEATEVNDGNDNSKDKDPSKKF